MILINLFSFSRYEDCIRKVVYDVVTAVPDLADPTEVRAAGRLAKEPELRPQRHTADGRAEGPLQLNLI